MLTRRLSRSILRQKFQFCSSKRDQIDCDVLVVGAGPAGLSTAIRLKQLAKEQGKHDPSVIVIEKAAAIGGHILSGNCFEPTALNELFPNWNTFSENRPPVETKVTQDQIHWLPNNKTSIQLPSMFHPKKISNQGNYIISLGDLCVWLSERAQELGVDIFPGTAGANILYHDNGAVRGISTGDMGINKNGEKKDNFTPGIDIIAKQTVMAEGARGSLSEQLISKYDLRKDSDPQIYGLGIKEVWEVPDDVFVPGLVQHTLGWPLDIHTYGGSFLYHMGQNRVHIGMVVGLDYKNPSLNPYEEFQLLKTHPLIRKVLERGSIVSYGARSLNEGGYYSIPKLTFPGGVLVGCSAGFLDVMKIKGSHNAMKSGMVAAQSIYERLHDCEGQEISDYEVQLKKTWIYKELHETRNFKGAFKGNLFTGLIHGALSGFLMKGREPWSLRSQKKDSESYTPLKELDKGELKTYPKHDGKLTFDLLENLQRSGTYHDHDQPSHLQIKKEVQDGPQFSYGTFGGPEQNFCPAKVYEYIDDGKGGKKLQINSQNCVHCKTCDLNMPKDYIRWTVPEGGGGPNYNGM